MIVGVQIESVGDQKDNGEETTRGCAMAIEMIPAHCSRNLSPACLFGLTTEQMLCHFRGKKKHTHKSNSNRSRATSAS